ncbi:MAG: mannose-1-phosphate guanylyltransferase/mannose-6-phosphate isomerase [Xanthomonadales bacterium]|nr:mannose-1-phosphate guanylyltransferase/mannose-6-phosphate isomerase [Xanthomonadales bacterium]
MLIPVIMSGGAGTRLWPVSRRAHPKPFMQLADNETLMEKTLARALAVTGSSVVLTVTSRDYYFLTRDEYLKNTTAGITYEYILEPFGRNTAPAIALAALRLQAEYGGETKMLVMPADHLIADQKAFKTAVYEAEKIADTGQLVTFGVNPTHAETGYGYLLHGEKIADSNGYKLAAFEEKPDLETALKYLDSGDYRWNSGMFLFRVNDILQALATHAPDVYNSALEVWSAIEPEDELVELPAEEFSRCPSISIDYAVMEEAENCAMVSGDFGWSDIGSWKAIRELYESDATGNRIRGKGIMINSSDCFVQSDEGRIVAAIGVHNLVIIDTGDAVLVSDAEHSQEVKQVVSQLNLQQHESAIFHKTVHRPWGYFTVLEDANDCKVKRLVVKPGCVLSLQRHQRRSEHWTVVAGTARVRVGDEEFSLKANQSTYIPVDTMHRLENAEDEDLHLIEVQTGDYFGEDDIERFEDVYGRS